MGTWPARLRRLMKHAHVIAVAAALLLAGCTSGEQSCPVGKTGGWFSGWGQWWERRVYARRAATLWWL